MSESADILKEEFQDPEYRHAYAEDFLNTSVATQIRVLRDQRGWTQEDLAEKIGTKQAGISRLENVNYSGWKTETLRKIARAFDVRLKITFESFGTLLDEAKEFSRKSLQRPSFSQDPIFHQPNTAPENVKTTFTTSTGSIDPFLISSYGQITVADASGGTWSLEVKPETIVFGSFSVTSTVFTSKPDDLGQFITYFDEGIGGSAMQVRIDTALPNLPPAVGF